MFNAKPGRSADAALGLPQPERATAATRKARKKAEREGSFTLQNYVPYLVNRLAIATLNYNATSSEFTLHGVSTYRILMVLRENRVCRFGELAKLTSIEPPTLSRLLNALETDGFVRRRRSITDTRSVMISLSPQGRTLAKRLIPYSLTIEDVVVDGMAEKDVQLVKQLLTRMYDNVVRHSQGTGKRK
jgi:DNA-binding MarR family transcriptional regulator